MTTYSLPPHTLARLETAADLISAAIATAENSLALEAHRMAVELRPALEAVAAIRAEIND